MKPAKKQKKNNQLKDASRMRHNHEITGILLFAFGILALLSFYFKNSIGLFGLFIRDSFTGLLGITAFLLPPLIIICSVLLILNKYNELLRLRIFYLVFLIILISSLIQTGFYNPEKYRNLSILKCIVRFYTDGKNLNGGGILGGLVSMPFLRVFQTLGTIIVLTALAFVDIILLTNMSIAGFLENFKFVFLKAFRRKTTEKNNGINFQNTDSLDFEFDEGKDENLDIEFAPNPRVIDFKIQKIARELKAGTGGSVNKKTSKKIEDVAGTEPVRLIAKDLDKIKMGVYRNMKKSPDDLEEGLTPDKKNAVFDYEYPPTELLNKVTEDDRNLRNYKNKAIEAARKLEETLSSFGVEAKVVNISRGPAVTRFELQPRAGVKVSRIVNLADDISLNLASQGVRIEAPIPGKAAIGIEVPNREISLVLLREVLESPEFTQHPSRLAFAIGKDISGECVVGDIAKMPHLLIAGATGAGKSVCINSIIISLLYKAAPSEVKMLMIDPKVVELSIYNGIPHLLIPVVTDPRKASSALNWAVQEMVNRYKLFAEKGVRDIKGYNEEIMKDGEKDLLPQIVIIIDELADLMMVAPNEVEDAICRLAQMARAAGMHLVIATQRPSVDVITGIIKANIPSRISFAVSSQVDSRTILDMGGAEKLLGKGDMLFNPVGQSKPIRIQGAFVSEKEVERVTEFLKSRSNADYNSDIIDEINSEENTDENNEGDRDELLPKVIEMVVETGQASASLIQRKFKVGYARAARIIDQMEARGIIGGYEGSKPRQILITKQQWQEMQMGDSKE